MRSDERQRVSHAPRALVGAIRWDAWVGDLPTYNERGPTGVGPQVERVLGPAHWHDRLPFYARELGAQSVEVRATSQDVIDQEIAYASAAGLDYWAFVHYAPGSGLDTARRMYLSSVRRTDIAFWLIVVGLSRVRSAVRDPGELLECFARPEHVRVLDGRPLLLKGARTRSAPAYAAWAIITR